MNYQIIPHDYWQDEGFTVREYVGRLVRWLHISRFQGGEYDGERLYPHLEWISDRTDPDHIGTKLSPVLLDQPASDYFFHAEMVVGVESWVLHVVLRERGKPMRWDRTVCYLAVAVKGFDPDLLFELQKALTYLLWEQPGYMEGGVCVPPVEQRTRKDMYEEEYQRTRGQVV